MKVLQNVVPTPEQLGIVSSVGARIEVIRGGAGSGKTTTALMRLRGLIRSFSSRRERSGSADPIRALVITFNRTLSGYIDELLQGNVFGENVYLEVSTFGKWSRDVLNETAVLDTEAMAAQIVSLGTGIPLTRASLIEEVEYVLGLYLPDSWEEYLNSRRHGRGNAPRIDLPLRVRILNQVIRPYSDWKRQKGVYDWADLAVRLAQTQSCAPYDIVVADESQDYSANQIRAILNHTAQTRAVTLIADTAQRIYKRAYTLRDVGIEDAVSHRLAVNYRNTRQIIAFAAPLLEGLIDQEATMPDASSCQRTGPLPQIVIGLFSEQIAYVINYIREQVDLVNESVAFLQPKGGSFFNATRKALSAQGLPYVEITRERNWPQGTQNIALSTIASAKGVEFDHVFMLGLSPITLTHGIDGNEDDEYQRLRRLLAMGICRARKTVVLGQKQTEHSDLLDLFIEGTFEERIL